jgi:hypothetical protein
VAEVKEQGEIAIESNRGNTIKKNADPENPAVHIERPGNDVVKRASELQIDEKADGASGEQANSDSKEDKQAEPKKTEEKPAESEKKDEEKPAEAEQKDEDMKDAPAVEEKKDDAQTNGELKTEESKDKAKANAANDKPSVADAPKTGSKRKAEDSPAGKTNGTDDKPTEKKTKTEGEGEDDKPVSKKGETAQKSCYHRWPTASQRPEREQELRRARVGLSSRRWTWGLVVVGLVRN